MDACTQQNSSSPERGRSCTTQRQLICHQDRVVDTVWRSRSKRGLTNRFSREGSCPWTPLNSRRSFLALEKQWHERSKVQRRLSHARDPLLYDRYLFRWDTINDDEPWHEIRPPLQMNNIILMPLRHSCWTFVNWTRHSSKTPSVYSMRYHRQTHLNPQDIYWWNIHCFDLWK